MSMINQQETTHVLSELRGIKASTRVNHLPYSMQARITDVLPFQYSFSSFDRVGHVIELLEELMAA
jgi:hypothetical protein